MKPLHLTIRILALICLLLLLPLNSLAESSFTFWIDDEAGLLTDTQTEQLRSDFAELTAYMNAALVTTEQTEQTTSRFAERYAESRYGNLPAVLFFIDMGQREIYVYSNGSALKTITRADGRAITDNIYTLASRKDYYGCADAAFRQVLALLQGEKLARPVKHITNALIALLAAVLINYAFLAISRASKRSSVIKGDVSVSVDRNQKKNFFRGAALAGVLVGAMLSQRKIYHESSSGGHSGGGGSHGGGGHVGGGGGHRF